MSKMMEADICDYITYFFLLIAYMYYDFIVNINIRLTYSLTLHNHIYNKQFNLSTKLSLYSTFTAGL